MALGIGISRLTGLLRIAAITAALGVVEGRLADAYNLANAVPVLIYELVLGGVMSSVIVPVMVELIDEDRENAWKVAIALLNLGMIILTLVTCVGLAAAPWITQFYASRVGGAEAELQRHVITLLLMMLIPQIFFYGLAGLGDRGSRLGHDRCGVLGSSPSGPPPSSPP